MGCGFPVAYNLPGRESQLFDEKIIVKYGLFSALNDTTTTTLTTTVTLQDNTTTPTTTATIVQSTTTTTLTTTVTGTNAAAPISSMALSTVVFLLFSAITSLLQVIM